MLLDKPFKVDGYDEQGNKCCIVIDQQPTKVDVFINGEKVGLHRPPGTLGYHDVESLYHTD